MKGVKKAAGFGLWVPRSARESYLVMGRRATSASGADIEKTYEYPVRSIHMLHAMRFTQVIVKQCGSGDRRKLEMRWIATSANSSVPFSPPGYQQAVSQ